MTSDHFLIGVGPHRTSIWRRAKGAGFVWLDAPPEAMTWELSFDEIDGHPVDVFGLPLIGDFVPTSAKLC